MRRNTQRTPRKCVHYMEDFEELRKKKLENNESFLPCCRVASCCWCEGTPSEHLKLCSAWALHSASVCACVGWGKVWKVWKFWKISVLPKNKVWKVWKVWKFSVLPKRFLKSLKIPKRQCPWTFSIESICTFFPFSVYTYVYISIWMGCRVSVYIHTLYIYICIYIHSTWAYACIYKRVYIYIYIYIYIYTYMNRI